MSKSNLAFTQTATLASEKPVYWQERFATFPTTAKTTTQPFGSDQTLVQACLEGDQNAWKELVDKYGRLVYAVARRDGLSEADADDIVQIVFTIVLKQLRTLRNQASLSGWLAAIAHWQSLRLVQRTRPLAELDETVADGSTSVFDLVRRWERREMVRQAIDRLDYFERELIYQLFSETPSTYAQIAAYLGIPVGSIGPTRARCFKKLCKILSDMNIDIDF
ncbi:MAG: sigma-70 family RNA polymerase sigma factor [Chloroflexi bacterium]|nr:sigma-70 family RNA polymerase sigma factor [Chloroflexota bacterium]